jgi:peptidoglycan/LPS O-acetylase OafA/YrhL
MGIGASIYLIGTVRGRTERSFAFFGLEKFGEFSYEVYLFHMFLLIGLAPVFQYPLPLTDNDFHKEIGTLWPVAVVMGLLAASYLISRFYSELANRIIRSLGKMMAAGTLRNSSRRDAAQSGS